MKFKMATYAQGVDGAWIHRNRAF